MNKTRCHFFWSPVGCGSQKLDLNVFTMGLQNLLGWCLWFFGSNANVCFPSFGNESYQLMAGYLGDTPFRGLAPPVDLQKSLLVGFLKFGFVHKLGFV